MPTFIARGTPSLGRVSLFWSRMAESIAWPAGLGKVLFYQQDKVGNEIAEGRNSIVSEVLEYDRVHNPVSKIFWLDDDVLPFSGCVLELLNQRAAIASGTYFFKLAGPASQPLIWQGEFGDGAMMGFEPDKVLDARYHGMGLTLVDTSVYKKMLPYLKEHNIFDKYGRPQWYRTGTDADAWQDKTGLIHLGFTEDVWFLDRAHECGIGPSKVVTTKHAFGFHTSAVWICSCGYQTTEQSLAVRHKTESPDHHMYEDLQGYPQKQWNQWVSGQDIVWDTPDGPVVWE